MIFFMFLLGIVIGIYFLYFLIALYNSRDYRNCEYAQKFFAKVADLAEKGEISKVKNGENCYNFRIENEIFEIIKTFSGYNIYLKQGNSDLYNTSGRYKFMLGGYSFWKKDFKRIFSSFKEARRLSKSNGFRIRYNSLIRKENKTIKELEKKD